MVGEAIPRLTRAMPIDPLKPMATRTLIQAVQGGETLIIFPEGRLTVTGSLMKVYDGAGLIADKSDATIVPIRIDGLERSPFTRLRKDQVRRKLFPKVTVTVLEPVKLNLDPALQGQARRRAAGAALYDIMSDMIYQTTTTDRTIPEALIAAGKEYGLQMRRDRGCGHRRAHLQAADARRPHPRQEADAARRARQAGRRDAAERQRRGGHDLRPDVGRPGAGDDQFHRRRRQYPRRLHARRRSRPS